MQCLPPQKNTVTCKESELSLCRHVKYWEQHKTCSLSFTVHSRIPVLFSVSLGTVCHLPVVVIHFRFLYHCKILQISCLKCWPLDSSTYQSKCWFRRKQFTRNDVNWFALKCSLEDCAVLSCALMIPHLA